MDIKAKKGTKVTFNGSGGYDCDVPNAIRDGLVVGKSYTVKSIDIQEWISYVSLQEVSGSFNTVMFG